MKKINIFNRKLLVVTCDLEKQAKIREVLSSNKINYVLVPFILSPNLNRCEPEYKFYVHKDDFEIAQYIINREKCN